MYADGATDMSFLYFGLLAVIAVIMAVHVWREITSSQSAGSNGQPSGSHDEIAVDDAVSDYLEVVGESHYQDALSAIAGPKTAEGANYACIADLVPEPSNVHDRNAVRVEVNGRRVGYLSRPSAKHYRAALAHMGRAVVPIQCHATIKGGWLRRKGEGHFGIVLDDFIE